jgi:hypothetical protein
MFESSAPDQEARVAAARAALATVQTRVGTSRSVTGTECWEAPVLPLATGLNELLPTGLRRGQAVAVEGSTSLVLALVAEASREGSWAAMIGMPQVGVVAATRRGIELARLALIPHPGSQAAAVAGACIDGMDVVVFGPRLALSDSDRRRLAARARERGGVIISAGPWAGAHMRLVVESSSWRGLGAGDGRLREREMTVAVSSRAGGRVRRVPLTLDADTGPRRSTRDSVGQAAAYEGAA